MTLTWFLSSIICGSFSKFSPANKKCEMELWLSLHRIHYRNKREKTHLQAEELPFAIHLSPDHSIPKKHHSPKEISLTNRFTVYIQTITQHTRPGQTFTNRDLGSNIVKMSIKTFTQPRHSLIYGFQNKSPSPQLLPRKFKIVYWCLLNSSECYHTHA